jgi:hypothetical protein
MPWCQLDDANDPKLDELAEQYNLHASTSKTLAASSTSSAN